MPQGDDEAREVEEAGVHGDASVIADHQTTEVADPGEGALDLPSAPVPAQRSAVLKNPLPAFPRWCDQLNSPCGQLRAERIAVVSLVADHPDDQPAQGTPRTRRSHLDGVERFLDELDLGGRGRIKVGFHRNALAIDQNHPLCFLAPLGFSDAEAPLFAGAKLPSMEVSSHSSRWSSSSMPSSRCQARSSVPSSSHLRSCRQTVAGLPYCHGKSFHRAPERAIHKMPSALPGAGPGASSSIPAVFRFGKQRLQRLPLRIREVGSHVHQGPRPWEPRKFSALLLWMVCETTSSVGDSRRADRVIPDGARMVGGIQLRA